MAIRPAWDEPDLRFSVSCLSANMAFPLLVAYTAADILSAGLSCTPLVGLQWYFSSPVRRRNHYGSCKACPRSVEWIPFSIRPVHGCYLVAIFLAVSSAIW